MNPDSQSFAPEDFIASLERDEISPPIVVRGMAKKSDDDQYLQFAPGARCSNWIEIPLASIETVDVVDVVPCKDHTHPLVNLRLKAPETAEGKLFASLAQAGPDRSPGRGLPGGGRGRRLIRGAPPSDRRMRRGPGNARPAESEWAWCDSLADYEVDADGNIYCMDWCWESEHVASYSQC